MSARVARNIILVGFMGTGKSSLARLLARRTGGFLVDTDLQIEKTAGCAISKIFASRGEVFFREMETALLESYLEKSGLIVSTGGGMVVQPRNREILQKIGLVVWLQAAPEVIFERVSRNDQRPLLRTADPAETLRALYETREPFYREVAQLQIDTGNVKRARAASLVLETAGWKCKVP